MHYHALSSRRSLSAFAFALVFLGLPLVAGAQEAGGAEAEPAGFVRTELALDNRPLSFAFDSTLRATAPRPLLASGESVSETRIRLGELTVNPFLNIGSLDAAARREAGEPPVVGATTVWLTRADDGWALELEQAPAEATEAEATEEEGEESSEGDDTTEAEADADAGEAEADSDAAADDAGIVIHVPLAREATEAQETLSAALVSTSDDSGQLVLRWHDHRWTADFDLLPLPTPAELAAAAAAAAQAAAEEAEEDEGPRVPTDTEQLDFDSDTSAGARALTLAERNDTAIVLPDESRISVLVWQEQLVDHADFAALATMGDGEVVRLTQGAVIRLRSEVPLQFGDTSIPMENLAPGFPGSYGLWLKRSGDGWRLVFNHEPDSWGTQHDPAFDAVEIELKHSEDGLETRSLGATLVPVTAHSGRLVIHWGAHEWAADFAISE
ncbi:MAG: DUF2911 domain-containing protein [Acidobacteria bacterium]|nr:DUF2911 domain-containing protein [Acidobacteriota bacterium]